jgi:ribosome recycling factor
MRLNKIEAIGEYKRLQIREIRDDGGYHRRVLTPDMTLADDEHQEVKDKAEAEWTDEVKSAWTTFQAEQEAELNKE